MVLQDLLSEDEIRRYHEEWGSFTGKYKLETPYNVHSGLPIIGQVFQFEGKPIFRAHIFKRKLRKAFDPYFVSKDGYLHPYFHIVHYCFPIEQVVHGSLSKIVTDYQKYLITDKFDGKKPAVMKRRVDFERNNPVSIEVIPKVTLGQDGFVLRASATFYEDKTNKPLQTWYFEGVGELRKYVVNIQRLKEGDVGAIEDLKREIEEVDKKHGKMLKQRKYNTKEDLIGRLVAGEIPEEELHDFFSYWGKIPSFS